MSLNSFTDDLKLGSFYASKEKRGATSKTFSNSHNRNEDDYHDVKSVLFQKKKFDDLNLSSSSSTSSSSSSASTSTTSSSSSLISTSALSPSTYSGPKIIKKIITSAKTSSSTNNNKARKNPEIEPYLAEFEAELLQSSKCEIIKDLSNLKKIGKTTPTTKMSQKGNSGGGGGSKSGSGGGGGGSPGEHIFKKYLNDLRNLTVGRKSSIKLDEEPISGQDEDEEEIIRDDDDDDEEEDDNGMGETIYSEKSNNEGVCLEKLRNQTKSQIPWNNLDSKSAQLLLSSYLEKPDVLPVLYSRKGNKISANQVCKSLYTVLMLLIHDFT